MVGLVQWLGDGELSTEEAEDRAGPTPGIDQTGEEEGGGLGGVEGGHEPRVLKDAAGEGGGGRGEQAGEEGDFDNKGMDEGEDDVSVCHGEY